MRPTLIAAVAAAGLALVLGASPLSASAAGHKAAKSATHVKPTGKVHTVHIRSQKFIPAELEVGVGDEVKWENDDLVPHSATADDKAFDTGLMSPGKSGSWIAPKAGEYKYYCSNHPEMRAVLTVK